MKRGRFEKIVSSMDASTRIMREIISSIASGADAAELANKIWEAHSKIECAILFLKLEAGVEEPGRPPSPRSHSEDAKSRLVLAEDCASEAREAAVKGDHPKALERARKARDTLREVLLQLRRSRASTPPLHPRA